MKSAILVLVVLVVGVASLVLAGHNAPTFGSGEEWLSWKPEQRNAWVDGYVSGYLNGKNDACAAAESLAPNPNAHPRERKNQPSEFLAVRCREAIGSFDRYLGFTPDGHWSGPHPELYAPIITGFYEKHADYRVIAYQNLMSYLGDGGCKSADDLVRKVNSSRIRK